MKKAKRLFAAYKSIILYVFFGVCTTAINWAAYYLLYKIMHTANVPANIIAWIIAVTFAFITNKIFVFTSKSFSKKTLFHEIWTFLTARLATGVLDVLIMYLAVDVLLLNPALWKLISNIIVIILNYILSKLIIFKKHNT